MSAHCTSANLDESQLLARDPRPITCMHAYVPAKPPTPRPERIFVANTTTYVRLVAKVYSCLITSSGSRSRRAAVAAAGDAWPALEAHAATSCSGWSTFSRHPPCRRGPAAAASSDRDLTTGRSIPPAEQSCRLLRICLSLSATPKEEHVSR